MYAFILKLSAAVLLILRARLKQKDACFGTVMPEQTSLSDKNVAFCKECVNSDCTLLFPPSTQAPPQVWEKKRWLEHQFYIENSFLEPDTVGTGDIFEKTGEIYINIRPCCDFIPRKEQDSIDSVDLYLLKGERMKNLEKIGKFFSPKHGHFFEHDNNAMFYPICGKSLITFNFKNLIIKSCGEIKQYRKGRLLHPFITKLQMKYASYLLRQGLPRLPGALFGISEDEGNDI